MEPVGADSSGNCEVRLFFKNFVGHVHFWESLIPLFWVSGDVSSGFQSQSRQPYSHLAEKKLAVSTHHDSYVIYVP